ncbi:type IV secretion protein Rhs [Kosakonia cowanii]|uniref:RHS repeat domain-containing protein n=1 Tax=Kosakonia cowanii TaxID=208223 RepID=UPI000B977AB5|nr:RHS repeat-associated core domain-containing protein [Kosakonia cowanii]AST67374.1 type IV secretion protein Rhs [Kosakonia cowanii]
MSEKNFYSSAINFLDSVQGGVDPRTGLFNVSLPLAHIRSGKLVGPKLDLSLQYSPLSTANEGFGMGFTLNLSRYNTDTGKLVLFTGEEYRVNANGVGIKQKKLKNFLFRKQNDGSYLLIHKCGLIEHLTRRKSLYVPSHITAPDGRGLNLTWSSNYPSARLTQVTDDDGKILFTISYPANSSGSVIFFMLPDDVDMGYKVTFTFTNEHLVRVTSNADEPALVWTFDYADVGPNKNFRVITGLTSSTGLKEKVTWYTDRGMEFPDIAGLPALPCVHKHMLMPGGGQPECTTEWTWTKKNYLGKDASMNQWHPDSDEMLNTLLNDYFYGSTANVLDTDGSTVLSTTIRRYNSFHLQVSETTVRDGKTYSLTTQYYAKPGVAFDKQPEQYALPVSQTESWDDGSGAQPRTRATLMRFDNEGNLLRQETPDGTVTEYAYYPADGEGNACPADPYGFVRWLKKKTVTPPQIRGDEPVSVTLTTWIQLPKINEDSYTLVTNTVTHNSGNARQLIAREYYIDASDNLCFLREKSRITTLTPDVNQTISFSSRQDFTYQDATEGLRQSVSFTGHDGVIASRSNIRHAYTGLLLSETNEQFLTTTYTYDKLGRPLISTLASGTVYENSRTWCYAIEDSGPVTTETDASGNKVRTYFDCAGRSIREQRLDRDSTGKWFDIKHIVYNPLGEVVSGDGNDWLTTAENEKYTVSMTATYDGWGSVSQRAFCDNTLDLQEKDPVSLRHSVYMMGGAGDGVISTGRVITEYDERSFLPVTETKTTTSGEIDSDIRLTWDGLGRLLAETDECGNKTERTYDAYGRVLTQTLPDGSIVTRTYAPHLIGNYVASISMTGPDREGNTQTWLLGTQSFDSLGRVTEQVSGGRTTSWVYDGASPVPASVTLPSGSLLEYSYIPELGNVLNSLTASDVKKMFSYDNSTGQLLISEEGSTKNTRMWNPSGTLRTETFSRGDEGREALNSYTLSGDDVTYKDIAGKTTRYERDSFGRVSAIADDTLTVRLKYDALSRLSEQQVASISTEDTLRTSLTYDDFSREIARTFTDSSGVTVIESRTWLKNSLLETKTTRQNGCVVREEKYEYDARNRLTGYSASGSSLPQDAFGQVMISQAYRYDALNNLTTVSTKLADGSSDVATYYYENADDPTQLSSVTHTHDGYPKIIALTYNANGQMILDEAGRTLDYDSMGRLISVNKDAIKGAYGYDALDRLVSQRVSDDDTRQLYYRAGELVNEVMMPQSRETRLIKTGHQCFGVSSGDALKINASDLHDSPVWSRDVSEAEGRQHVWSPYGIGDTEDLFPGFNGERVDPVSGTYHLGNGYRTYNPVLMRFNCPDNLSPFGAGGINPYAYCSGDPVNHTDPSGHISWQGILGIVTGAVGLALSLFSAGASIAAASGVIAALGAASTTSFVLGGLGVAADVTAIASGATEDSNPQASSVLGWISMATGLAGLSKGITQGLHSGLYGSSGKLSSIDRNTFRIAKLGLDHNLTTGEKDFLVYSDNFKNRGIDVIVAHGNKKGELTMGILDYKTDAKGRVEIVEDDRLFLSPTEFSRNLRDNWNINLYKNSGRRGAVHLVVCYAKRTIAQELADEIKRPVIAYSKHKVVMYGDVMGNIESSGVRVYAEYRRFHLKKIFRGLRDHIANPQTFFPN